MSAWMVLLCFELKEFARERVKFGADGLEELM